MYKFDEWLSDCPVPFTQEKDNGDWITFNFEVSVLEKEKKRRGKNNELRRNVGSIRTT